MHVGVNPKKKREVLSLVKKNLGEIAESRVISCQNQIRTLNAVI